MPPREPEPRPPRGEPEPITESPRPGRTGDSAPEPSHRDPSDPPLASKDQSRLPSIFFPAPTQSER